MKTVRWGIVGCGDVTEIKSGPGFAKADNSSLVAVMRRDGALARDYAQRHGVPRWYDDADRLLADSGVDAVYVATRPDTHRDYVLKCAAAGKPVLVEKPMAMNAAECEDMIQACRAARVPLFVAYYHRALPLLLKVKELIDAGAVGAVRFVTILHNEKTPTAGFDGDGIPWRYLPDVGGGGVFVDIGSHALDFLDFLFGPIEAVRGSASNQADLYPAEDFVTCDFSFAGGVRGSGTWSFATYRDFERTEIVGDKGMVTLSLFSPSPVVLTTEEGRREFDIGYPPHVHQPLIQTVVDDLIGTGKCPSTGDTALRATRVIDTVLKDYANGLHTGR